MPSPAPDPARSVWQLFLVFLRLGLTAFGGPVAHLAHFQREFVQRRQWLSERSYADLVALCQFLPGPASSQVGMAIGLMRHGYAGALAAWAGFTLPSALALMAAALGLARHGQWLPAGGLHGLKVVAVAVVAQAVWAMARSLCPDWPRQALMLTCAALTIHTASPLMTWAMLAGAGLLGSCCFTPGAQPAGDALQVPISRRAGLAWLLLCLGLLLGLPLALQIWPQQALAEVNAFYRAGALVFGGGHVVLPMLQAEVVAPGWVSADTFLAGYGLAQAVPGPLFSFAAFLGAAMQQAPTGWAGGWLCLLAVFAPAFLLVAGALPWWAQLRSNSRAQAALMGVNAAVVGLLLAALYDPVWVQAISSWRDLALAALALLALHKRVPAWAVVLGGGVLGAWLLPT